MKRFLAGRALLALIALSFTACGGGSSSSSSSSNGGATQAHVFVTGEDAPVSSVVAFNITINKITLNNKTTSAVAMNTPTAVDFGRLVGLRSLLGFNAVAAGTYTSATIAFSTTSAPTVDYIDLSTTPPSLAMATGVLSNPTVTVAFPAESPLVVGASGLAGLHMDFDLRDSLAISNGNLVINNGQIAINPVVNVQAVSASSALGQITEFTGNVVSVGTTSFVMQGPYGFQETIDVDSNTQYNGSTTLSSLAQNDIVDAEGTVQADGSILANNVELITTDRAFISGRILSVSPGPVVTMFVGEELGASAAIPVDTVVQNLNLSAINSWDICFMDNFFTNELFNSSNLVVGQRIFVGGTVQGSSFTPNMVSLRRQGVMGSLVANSVKITSGNIGSFEMQNDALMSYAANGPFPIDTDNRTVFFNINGLMGLQSAGAANLVVTGLVFDNPQKLGTPVVWSHRVWILP
jgi:Domain of unknown function (DUF5666)/Domain of unknown function (DUF4382)